MGAEEGYRAEGLQQDDRDVAGSVGADDKGLLDVGGLGGAGDEAAEVVGVEVLPGVGFVHVAHYLLSVQQDDEGFGDEQHGLVPECAGYPDGAVLDYSEGSADYGDIGAGERSSSSSGLNVAQDAASGRLEAMRLASG